MQAPSNESVHTLLCLQHKKLSSKSLCNSGPPRPQVRVCFNRQQHSLQLRPPSSSSVWAAPPPSSPSLAATWCPPVHSSASHEDQRSHRHTIALRHRFTSNRSHSWFRRTFVVTYCMRASHADVHPELLQDTREPGDHVQDGAPHLECRFVVKDSCCPTVPPSRTGQARRKLRAHRAASAVWPRDNCVAGSTARQQPPTASRLDLAC